MVSNQHKFTVLLDQVERTNAGGFSLQYQIRGAPFYRTGTTGLADSAAAVQEAHLLQAPTYFLGNGFKLADRGKEKPSEEIITEWHDGLGERLTLQTEGYKGIPDGLHAVDIQGAGIFMPRPQEIRAVIEGKDPARRMKNYAYPVSQQEKDRLLGDKVAYRWNGTKLEENVPVTFFPSPEAFLEEARTPEFKRKLKDMTAVYAVVRSAKDARKIPSGYRPLKDQLTNPDLTIPLGGEDPVREMLLNEDGTPRFGWEQFGAHNDGYQTVDSGRVALLSDRYDGVSCDYSLYLSGRSVGVAPEALVARAENGVFKNPPLDELVEALRGTLGRI